MKADTRKRQGVWGGVSPPTGGGIWGKGCAPAPEKFSIFELKKRVLVHSGTDKTYFLICLAS